MTHDSAARKSVGATAVRRSGKFRRFAGAVLAAVLLVAAGCGDEDSAGPGSDVGTIDRDTFVATYVDLRLAALSNESGAITPSQRERILEGYGVSGSDLLRFVEVHGDRVEFMREVWNDVDDRIRAAAARGDTTSS